MRLELMISCLLGRRLPSKPWDRRLHAWFYLYKFDIKIKKVGLILRKQSLEETPTNAKRKRIL